MSIVWGSDYDIAKIPAGGRVLQIENPLHDSITEHLNRALEISQFLSCLAELADAGHMVWLAGETRRKAKDILCAVIRVRA